MQEGVEIELPDFDELFKRIQLASPLAKVAIEQAAKPEIGRSHFHSVEESKCVLCRGVRVGCSRWSDGGLETRRAHHGTRVIEIEIMFP